jgi:hypothetical protein
LIAFGREPHAVTGGATADELEKRVAAELMNASPVLFLDNLNDTALRSSLLASAITERPARVRVLGHSKMVNLNSSALVVLTGNGLSVSEDLARRFISLELDPRTEHPEARSFARDVRVDVRSSRAEMLTDLLTIWRWGRQEVGLEKGRPLGSFDQWCRWVRDPLLALGCCDPAMRVGDAKQKDARRQWVAEVFTTWWDRHGDKAMALRDLHPDVLQALDRQQRGGRQHQASLLTGLVGTRLSGFVLARKHPAGKWGTSKYALAKTPEAEEHRGHRDHRVLVPPGPGDTGPVPPMPIQLGSGFELGAAFEEESQAFLDERAAIAQFEGGLSRAEAEVLAMSELVAFFPRAGTSRA